MAKKVKLTKEQKWIVANQEFVDGVIGLSVGDLNVKLSTLSKNAEEVQESLEEAMEPGESLKNAMEEVAQLKGPFTDAKKLLKQKSKFVYRLLKDKGGK